MRKEIFIVSNVELGTLYDMNKSAVAATGKGLTRTELKKALREINQFFCLSKDKYFMLLCRERYDFTLFNLNYKEQFSMRKLMDDFAECLTNRGEVVSIEEVDNAFEIWIKIDDQAFVYYLFPYDIGVIEEV